MKTKAKYLLAMAIVSMSLFACQEGEKQTPEKPLAKEEALEPEQTASEAAEIFLMALENGDFDQAKEYATRQTKKELDRISKKRNLRPAKRKVKINREFEEKGEAEIYYTLGESTGEKVLDMMKIEGKWKAFWITMNNLGTFQESFMDPDKMDDLGKALNDVFRSMNSKEKGEAKENQDDNKSPWNDTYYFEGTINNQYPIKMTLKIKSPVVAGKYAYTTEGNDLSLEGTVNEYERYIQLRMDETNSQGRLTGKFVGDFDGETFKGTWTNIQTEEVMTFRFTNSAR